MKDDFQIDDFVDEISRSINGPSPDDYEDTWDTLPRIEHMEPTEEEDGYTSNRHAYERHGSAYDAQRPARRRKHHFFRNLLVFILILAAVFTAAFFLLGKQPVRNDAGASREAGHSTILLCGTDEGGYRTDTIMLISLDSKARSIAMLSIPRDTYCDGYRNAKINAALGSGDTTEEGMENLMQRVYEKIGFRPDGYVLVDLDAFIDIVDLMGGVDFEVPVDMQYSDPAQDLYIDLREGMQHLDGEQAMGVVRFRSGYAMADLTRVTVQRDFVKAAMSQWLSLKNLLKAPKLMSIVKENVTTDLSKRNMLWITRVLLFGKKADMMMETLPGVPETINGGSYYVLDDSAVKELMKNTYSPYK